MSTKFWLCFVSFLCLGATGQGEEDKLTSLERKLLDRLAKLEKNSDLMLSNQKSLEDRISRIAASISTLDDQSAKILKNHYDLVIPSCSMAKVPGVYRLQSPNINVLCKTSVRGGGWMVIQQRLDGELNFNRNWYAYRTGFGTVGVYTDYWLGLEVMHQITSSGEYELRVEVQNEEEELQYAEYSEFKVAAEADDFRLTIGGYSGTAGDALGPHNNTKFSTYDADNDGKINKNCAEKYQSGWWFTNCRESNLNGPYEKDGNGVGIKWGSFTNAGTNSAMMIRRK